MIEPWRAEFNLTAEQVGWIIGTAFWGFTLAMVVGGPLVDIIGMKRIIYVAFTFHVAGILLTIFAGGFWSLFFSTLLIGIANGSVETSTNPLITAMYPDAKTKKLNQFHVWFPGGNRHRWIAGICSGSNGIRVANSDGCHVDPHPAVWNAIPSCDIS